MYLSYQYIALYVKSNDFGAQTEMYLLLYNKGLQINMCKDLV